MYVYVHGNNHEQIGTKVFKQQKYTFLLLKLNRI